MSHLPLNSLKQTTNISRQCHVNFVEYTCCSFHAERRSVSPISTKLCTQNAANHDAMITVALCPKNFKLAMRELNCSYNTD